MASIIDVAKLARVSTATVSRVLNDGVASAATRARVKKAIKAIGYQPDGRASSLRSGFAPKVGLLLPDISNPNYSSTAKYVHDLLVEKKLLLILGCTNGNAKTELEILQRMQRERVAGVLLSTCEGEESAAVAKTLKGLTAAGIPTVLLGKSVEGFVADTLTVDNVDGMRQVARYLWNSGRRQIGFLAGARGLRSTEERLRGLQVGLAEVGAPAEALQLRCEGEYSLDNGDRLAQEMLNTQKVDALACGNDLLAIGALRVCEQRGIKVPSEMAITGFDDSFLAETIRPRLTTVRAPQEQITREACELLLGRVDKTVSGSARERVFPCQLIVRDSA